MGSIAAAGLRPEEEEQDGADELAEDDDQRPNPLAAADRDALGRRLDQHARCAMICSVS